MHAKPQFSLKVGLVAVTLFCFAVAGFAYANVFSASAWFSFVLGLLCCAALGSLCSRGPARAFGIGFCVVGSAYLAAVYGPAFDRRIGFWLITTKAMSAIQLQLTAEKLKQAAWILEANVGRYSPAAPDEVTAFLSGPTIGVFPQWTSFQMVGHSVLALLIAWSGGLFAARLYEKNRNGSE